MNRKIVAIASALAILTANALTPPAIAQISTNTKLSWVTPKDANLRLTLTPKFTSTGERILNLELRLNGKAIERVQAVSGKPDVQHFRTGQNSKAGSREPLPQGVYRVGSVDRNGGLPYAMGDTFIPVVPLFATSRSGIGIHRDADRHVQGGSGTIGCLGILSANDVERVASFVTTYRVRTLIVDYGLN